MLDAQSEVTGSAYYAVGSDEAALLAAQAWLGRHPAVEVWKGTRVVATLIAAAPALRLHTAAREPGGRPWSDPDPHSLIA